ncbi:MAG: transcription-repair coupling factor [Lachnospiraceae bacterium]|nr:transcription-repair coupling factor [Lachnospiraceae bacterium]
MKLLNHPMGDIPWMGQVKERLKQQAAQIAITGSADSHKLHLINTLAEGQEAVLILTYSERRAREIYEEYLFYDKDTLLYPAKDLIFYQADINGKQTSMERLRVLSRILMGRPGTIVTTLDTLLGYCLPLEAIRSNLVSVVTGGVLDETELAAHLTAMGYEKSYQVEAPGQFSIRGGIVDVFDLTAQNPYRIELWGDEVESIRSFDVESQRSIETLEKITVFPASEMILTEEQRYAGFHRIETEAKAQQKKFRDMMKTEEAHRIGIQLQEVENQLLYMQGMLNLESYLHYFYSEKETTTFLKLFGTQVPLVFLDEPTRLLEHVQGVEAEFRESMSHRLEKGLVLPGQTTLLRGIGEILLELKELRSVQLMSMERAERLFDGELRCEMHSRTLASYNGSFLSLIQNLKELKKEKYKIVILCPSRTRAKRLADEIQKEDVIASYTENEEKELQPGEIVTCYGRIRKGFSYPEIKYTVIAETDIFGAERKNRRKKPKYTGGKKVRDYAELHVGDYVIHENYGVGIYRGIEKVEVEHVQKDYMKIEYKGGSNLFVLATSLDMIQLYADKDSKKPKLNKLGTQEWHRTKEKVKTAVAGVARELVSLYAVRSQRIGYAYSQDTVWQKEFEEMFPYEETEDQLNAIASVKDDMESTKIMDRLVCGDVGFGKTEVAIRAAFKAVQEGKQVAYLVPTTILAEQHFNTFRERMSQYPVRVEMLSRFRTPAQIKKTLADLKKGLVDIVIGTHRLLSKDVEYADLGLLVVDEEQRFGVNHKEKIKQLKENVDVLTLTATPIPRTLHMSLIGIRDMSLLEEAPQNRQPIQTYVCEFNEEMVREAIRRELNRGGQVYYVYNRVETIQDIAAMVAALVPEARVAYAHGQMQERELEDLMMNFIKKEIDVLVSTTIIETGLDIPNVNTMIIHDSDQLGLSQLYQLRGRVGRSDRTSYAFLMYRRNRILSEVAEKRLTAIREFTELGSGFKIAMRDLEIRGAGTLLGKQQHGQIESVGYDLYCKLLEEAVREEQGLQETVEVSCTVDLDVDAFIPSEYIVNEIQKLDIYKRVALIRSEADADAMRDELRDRFGSLPKQAENLLRIALVKARAASYHITEVKGKVGRIRFVMDRNAPVETLQIPVLVNEYAGDLRMQTGPNPEFIYIYDIIGLVEQDSELLMDECEKVVSSFQVLYQKPAILLSAEQTES